jgi:hypothetical protein
MSGKLVVFGGLILEVMSRAIQFFERKGDCFPTQKNKKIWIFFSVFLYWFVFKEEYFLLLAREFLPALLKRGD